MIYMNWKKLYSYIVNYMKDKGGNFSKKELCLTNKVGTEVFSMISITQLERLCSLAGVG